MKTRKICESAAIAALYVVLTYVSSLMGLASGVIQVRLSEALCAAAILTDAAIPGLTIGCALANLLTGSNVFDILFGSLATYLGALCTYRLRKREVIALIPPIVSNMIIVPLVLRFAYGVPDAYFYMVGTVGIGEIISVGIFGYLLLSLLKRWKIFRR